MLALKQEMRGTMKRLPYNIPLLQRKADWTRLPKELMPQKKKVKRKPEVKKKPKKETSKEKRSC
uniref:Uncharacterized protein n=1 Tax=Anguilla anguilla TaxID=7936 RepID=A0A0E9UVU7_ANGAN